jgi:uncharacterized membrane protein
VEKETARIEAFSDGVFAIAITILVLDLHAPSGKEMSDTAALLSSLKGNWPSYCSFMLSFFSIYIMWVNHHKIFKQVYKRNSAVMFANGLLLFLATSVSYPTALIARYYNTPSANTVVAIYTGLFVLINLSFNLLWYVCSRDKTLLRPEITDKGIKQIKMAYLAGLPIHLIAFVTAFFSPAAALVICVSLWSYWALTSSKLHTPGTIRHSL